ncbi:rod shape-determining protein MreC [Thalassotalea eurytherma]|uniref:Cell shape-determining protein MreC n=1 Tax=Thalassotalea eurytherma TaxID=1144278 RepID=A0ABQ6H6U3_9GAMM|nr:rod shape-determining protein MreC [Thalassotalea eurytherma]GLX83347.1 cell shape-determining protein MreC [Thalassotalea eurytherma]
MNPIFKHGPSAQHRLILVLCCSMLLIFFDHKMHSFDTARGYMQSMVSPLQYIANAPKQILNWTVENLASRKKLVAENQHYKSQQLIFNEQAMQLDILRSENARLRSLLASPVRPEVKKMVAEILAVDTDPYSHQILINKGLNDDVYEGQPVIDELGVVGQVLHAGATNSRILLISDVSHAIPLRIQRNGVRLIASGSGNIRRLIVNHVPHSTDIKEGDVLVTSGLGGKFPEGYPVAKVNFVQKNETRAFAQVYAEPIAQIDRLRYMLLLWPEPVEAFSTSEVQSKSAGKE